MLTKSLTIMYNVQDKIQEYLLVLMRLPESITSTLIALFISYLAWS